MTDILMNKINSLESIYSALENSLIHGGCDECSRGIVSTTLESLGVEFSQDYSNHTATRITMEGILKKIGEFLKKLWFNFINIIRNVTKRAFSLKGKLKVITKMVEDLIKADKVEPDFQEPIELHNYKNLLVNKRLPNFTEIFDTLISLSTVVSFYEDDARSYLNVYPDVLKKKVALGVVMSKEGASETVKNMDIEIQTILNRAGQLFTNMSEMSLFQNAQFNYVDAEKGFELVTDKSVEKDGKGKVDAMSPEVILHLCSKVPGQKKSNMLYDILDNLERINAKLDAKKLNRDMMEYINLVDKNSDIKRDYFLMVIKNFVRFNAKFIKYVDGVINHLFTYMIQSLKAAQAAGVNHG